ncbi:MAG TPA: hypothetical protein VFG89_05450 [Coriobacteriia bacterium]|nr:hypothetical protein [Coriobacteriia bacterium]
MAKCWEQRGCDEEMQAQCPHSADFHDNCPTKCAFAACDRPTHAVTTDPEFIFDTTVDRSAVIKDGCIYCEFFLKNGPRLVK